MRIILLKGIQAGKVIEATVTGTDLIGLHVSYGDGMERNLFWTELHDVWEWR